MSIEFSVEDGLAAAWDEPRISAVVDAIVARELGADYVIGLHLVGGPTIRSLNAQHRSMDAETDVLSFPLLGTEFVVPEREPLHLGDVVVSYPRAVQQAADYGHSVDREIGYLVAHGVLHVLGYDHEQEDERRRMREKEEEALRPLGLVR